MDYSTYYWVYILCLLFVTSCPGVVHRAFEEFIKALQNWTSLIDKSFRKHHLAGSKALNQAKISLGHAKAKAKATVEDKKAEEVAKKKAKVVRKKRAEKEEQPRGKEGQGRKRYMKKGGSLAVTW